MQGQGFCPLLPSKVGRRKGETRRRGRRRERICSSCSGPALWSGVWRADPFAMVTRIHLSALTAGHFVVAKWRKPCVPASGPTLRYGSLPSGIAPAGTHRRAIHGPAVLAGHPWPAPGYAIPPLSLLKGRTVSPGLAMYEQQKQKRKAEPELHSAFTSKRAIFQAPPIVWPITPSTIT